MDQDSLETDDADKNIWKGESNDRAGRKGHDGWRWRCKRGTEKQRKMANCIQIQMQREARTFDNAPVLMGREYHVGVSLL